MLKAHAALTCAANSSLRRFALPAFLKRPSRQRLTQDLSTFQSSAIAFFESFGALTRTGLSTLTSLSSDMFKALKQAF